MAVDKNELCAKEQINAESEVSEGEYSFGSIVLGAFVVFKRLLA